MRIFVWFLLKILTPGMNKTRVLYVSHEISPFLPESLMASVCRNLPQGMHEKGLEIRVFMPRFGKINERRHQLHEVIRLSGMNMIINDSDHPLIIKVASIPSARMQVYFIDNEEYFHRKAVLKNEHGKFFEDNDERSIFFVKGVLETVKKLGWTPDIIHTHGWMSALMPMYVKKHYFQDPHFSDTKLIHSIYNSEFDKLDKNMINKIAFDGIDPEEISIIKDPTHSGLNNLAVQYADAVVLAADNIDPEITSYINQSGTPFISHNDNDSYVNDIALLYEEVVEGKSILVD
jgi:starch synthase